MKSVLIVLIIFIFFNYVITKEYLYSCPNGYNHSLINDCHKGNLYFCSGFCLFKGNGNNEYNQFFSNSKNESPCPKDWISLSWGYQEISNKSLTWCTCKLNDQLTTRFYQVGNCGDSIEYNSTTLSFTNENHYLNIFTCLDNNSNDKITTFINITSIQLNDPSSTSFNCPNNSTNNFIWDYGNDVCQSGFYGDSCQFKDYCYLNICGNQNCENTDNIGEGYKCFCKEGYKYNGIECELDTCYIREYHELDCGESKCNVTSNQFNGNGTRIVVFNCYCDIGFTLSYKQIGNDFVKYCQKDGECLNSTSCGTADCINNGTADCCICLDENTYLFISDDGMVSCVEYHSDWKVPVSIMVSVIGFLFLGCISMFIYVKFFKNKTKNNSRNYNNQNGIDYENTTLDSQPLL